MPPADYVFKILIAGGRTPPLQRSMIETRYPMPAPVSAILVFPQGAASLKSESELREVLDFMLYRLDEYA